MADVKVYATDAGARIRIGTYGTATATSPAVVPASVAAALAGRPDLRIEQDPPGPSDEPSDPPAPPRKGKKG